MKFNYTIKPELVNDIQWATSMCFLLTSAKQMHMFDRATFYHSEYTTEWYDFFCEKMHPLQLNYRIDYKFIDDNVEAIIILYHNSGKTISNTVLDIATNLIVKFISSVEEIAYTL